MKYLFLILALLNLVDIVYTFMYPPTKFTFLGIDLGNIWVASLINLGLASLFFYSYLKYPPSKNENKA